LNILNILDILAILLRLEKLVFVLMSCVGLMLQQD